ncbi:MAG: aminotransferase class V-fold PLP-dependent enzyme [Candidatus Latescibacteria bacterium]|nr:aminotransferase class V-fold PLP-dependent enzyme [Candidatus Latescibacterota bacterium]NIM22107.1 aminotransferase class V-fold PLP-dependent enzyme [Candidatus Latescibacterota bacterium]NIM64657.1 aminotransferase class V-fold PLP-dependent enzyme [Candidatus Latescibacterota bacterium]NIO01167.1 aminotransferase class V-fold PLP-dependent enzyme [Candidatus Latescibacterota bacterium]NIO27552.1 aminotransferase class V-fold PLP-dependent enzyme [Candidatus Latescibacterota bacterium]
MDPTKLFTPGPTAVPRRVQDAMGQPLIHHRTEEFREILRDVTRNLQHVIRTDNPIVVFAASGTGAMEAALVNATKPGDKVLVTACGKFSNRWAEIAAAYGLDTIMVDAKWGQPVEPDQVEEALRKHDGVRAVFTTHTETSTGVLLDAEGIAMIAREYGALIVVDAITSLCAQEVKTDAWGVDVIVGGSQKGFGVPPGLSFLSLSKRALEKIHQKGHPCYYFDLTKALKALENWDTAYTPATQLILAMRVALSMIREEGLENVISRHEKNASAVRDAVLALGLELFASRPCNAATAVLPGKGSAGDIIRTMESHYGVKIAGGQAHLSGKIFRLGHLGFYTETDIHTLISALEGTLIDLGINPAPGKGVEAAMRRFQKARAD